MKHGLTAGLLGLALTLAAGRAEESFSKAIRPEDFAAAELNKLSPEALARLDELVQAYRSGAVTRAREEAEAEAAKKVAAAREEEEQKAKAAAPGLLARAKVKLVPGTEVTYSDVESRIAGDFKGWEGHTIFTLENGQRWQVANNEPGYYIPRVHHPAVKISPSSFGGFWMTIEGLHKAVRVSPLP